MGARQRWAPSSPGQLSVARTNIFAATAGDSRPAFSWLNYTATLVVAGGIATLKSTVAGLGVVRAGFMVVAGDFRAPARFVPGVVISNNGTDTVTFATTLANGDYGTGQAIGMLKFPNHDHGPIAWIQKMAPKRYRFLANTCFGGAKVEDVALQVEWLLATYPQLQEIFLQFGVNNYRTQSSDESDAVVWTKSRPILESLVNRNVKINLINEPQMAGALSNQINIDRCDGLNAKYAAFQKEVGRSRMTLVDICSNVRVGNATDLKWLMENSPGVSDNLHENMAMSNLISQLWYDEVTADGEFIPDTPTLSPFDSGNLWTNAHMPGPIGGLPAGFLAPTVPNPPANNGAVINSYGISLIDDLRVFELNLTFAATTDVVYLDTDVKAVLPATKYEIGYWVWCADTAMSRGVSARCYTPGLTSAGYDSYLNLNSGYYNGPDYRPMRRSVKGGRWRFYQREIETGTSVNSMFIRFAFPSGGAGAARLFILPDYMRLSSSLA